MIIPIRFWIIVLIFVLGFYCGRYSDSALNNLKNSYTYIKEYVNGEHRPCPKNTICIPESDIKK